MGGGEIEAEHRDFTEVKRGRTLVEEMKEAKILGGRDEGAMQIEGLVENNPPEIFLELLSFWLNTDFCYHSVKLHEVRQRINADKFK